MSGPPPAPGRRRPTIGDVAARAGVSKTTVSFVMNDRPNTGILPQTRERVLAAVAELGYVPNRQARNLGMNRTGVLGYHVLSEELDAAQLYSLSLFQALLRAADARDYQVVAFAAGPDEVVEKIRRMVAGNSVDGFVLHDVAADDPRVAVLTELGVPFAVWGRVPPGRPQSWVELDQRTGFHHVVDHLVGRGHRRIGYVGSTRPGYWWGEREAAFRERMAHHGLVVEDRDVVHGVADTAGRELDARLERVLLAPDRPTALVTAGDMLAVAVYRVAARLGLAVGQDLAVTGFDPLLWTLEPALTTLTISFGELAAMLVERFLREFDGPTDDPGQYLAATLRVAQSG